MIKIKFLLLLTILFINSKAHRQFIWNSNVETSDEDLEKAKNDALIKYFGDDAEDSNIFLNYENVSNLIGNYDDVDKKSFRNHDYDEMTEFIHELNKKYKDITHIYSIGKSTNGKDLWVLVISKNPKKRTKLKPEFKYVGNIHGNEPLGRECLLHLAELLCKNYGTNDYLTKLVNTVRIHMLFSMNPDGYENSFIGDRISGSGRSNQNNVDLNRNFPAQYPSHIKRWDKEEIQNETSILMEWMYNNPFVLSATLHGGALVVSYPLDDSKNGIDFVYTPSVDDKLFVQLSYQYARAHKNMWKSGKRCGLRPKGETFYHGIINGAQWYPLAGSMQDWQYLHTNALEVTVEMNCHKYPFDEMYEPLWNDNKYALIAYIDMVRYGLKGIVQDSDGIPIEGAKVKLIGDNKGKTIRTTKMGEYWRLLAPGEYTVKISHSGYNSKILKFEIKPRQLIIKNIILNKLPLNVENS